MSREPDDLIGYMEDGIFFDWIYRYELEDRLLQRYKEAERLYAYGTAQEIYTFLGVFNGRYTREDWLPILEERLVSLRNRITKLKTKRSN